MAKNKLLMKYLPPINPDGSVRIGNVLLLGVLPSPMRWQRRATWPLRRVPATVDARGAERVRTVILGRRRGRRTPVEE